MSISEIEILKYVENVCCVHRDEKKSVEAACIQALVKPNTVILSALAQAFIELCVKDISFENASGLFIKMLRTCCELNSTNHLIIMIAEDSHKISLGSKFIDDFLLIILNMKWSSSFTGLVLDACIHLCFKNKISAGIFHKATEILFTDLNASKIEVLVPRLLHIHFKDFYGSFCLLAHDASKECDELVLLSWFQTVSKIRTTRPQLKHCFVAILKTYSIMKPEAFFSNLVFTLYLCFSCYSEVLTVLKNFIFSGDDDFTSNLLDSVEKINNLPSCSVQKRLLMNLSMEFLNERKYEVSRFRGVKIGCKILKVVCVNLSVDEINHILRDLVIKVENTASEYRSLVLKTIKKIFKKKNMTVMNEIDTTLSIVSDFPNSEISAVLLNGVLPHMKSSLERKNLFEFLKNNFDLNSSSAGFSSLKILIILLQKFKVTFDAAVISEHTQGIFTQTYNMLPESSDQSSKNELLCLQVFGLVNRALNSTDKQSQVHILEGLHNVVRRNPGVAFPATRIMLKFALTNFKQLLSKDYDQIAEYVMLDEGLKNFCLLKEIYRYCWLTYQCVLKFFGNLDDDASERNMSHAQTMQNLFENIANFLLQNNHTEFIRDIQDKLADTVWNQVFRTIIGILECWVCNLHQQEHKDVFERNNSVMETVSIILKYQEALRKVSISLRRNNECSYDPLFVANMLYDIFCDSTDERQEHLAIFRNKEFIIYMLKSCKLVLKKVIFSDDKTFTTSRRVTFMTKISTFSSVVLTGLMDTVTADQEYLVHCIEMLDNIILSMSKRSDGLAFYHFVIGSGLIPADKLENIEDVNKVYGDFIFEILAHFETYYRLHSMKACDGLINIMQHAVKYMQAPSQEFSQLLQLWTNSVKNLNTVTCKATRTMMTFYFCLLKKRTKFDKIRDLMLLTKDLVYKLGDIEEEDESGQESNVFTIVTEDTANDVYPMVLNHISYVVSHILQKKVDFVARELGFEKNNACYRAKFEDMKQEVDDFITLGKKYTKLVAVLLKVKFNAMDTVLCENLLLLLINYYNMMNQFFKLFSGIRFEFDKFVTSLVKVTAKSVVAQTYTVINHLESFRDNKNKKMKYDGVKASKMLSKSIPTLIFSIENYEKQLMAISKKRKVSLLKYFRHSTARDFKINLNMLQEDVEN